MRVLSCPRHLSRVLLLLEGRSSPLGARLGLRLAPRHFCDSQVERVMKQRLNTAIGGGQIGLWLMRDVIVAADGGKCSNRLT